MKKKIFFTFLAGIVIIGIFFWWFFIRYNSDPSLSNQDIITCIVFQSENPLLPCFKEDLVSVSVDVPDSSVRVYTVEKTQENQAVYDCFSKNQVEANDCITQIAYEKKENSLCSFVSGAYSQAYCKERIAYPTKEIVNTSIVDVKISPLSFLKIKTNDAVVSTTKTNTTFSRTSDPVSTQSDSRFSLQGFYDRIKGAPLRLFAFSETQTRPGTELIASGFGFTSTDNTVSIGGYEVSGLQSSDGMTLSFVLPSGISEGTYDAWVTNSKGTSRNDAQPIRLTVTQNPTPRPVLTSVSPSVPSVSDTVTLSGEHLSGAFALYTSLGIVQNIYATNSSIQFNISDSSLISKIKDANYVKGKIVQVYVIVATPQGYNKDMFVFNVQF